MTTQEEKIKKLKAINVQLLRACKNGLELGEHWKSELMAQHTSIQPLFQHHIDSMKEAIFKAEQQGDNK